MKTKKKKENLVAFISYSQTNINGEKNIELIKELMTLSNDLRNKGIDIKIDQWDLLLGQDIYEFMEENVKSENTDKVLIISDEAYTYKANHRQGGVGSETQIITPELYKNTKSTKFIPIIWERDENGEKYLPYYISGRYHLDCSDREDYDGNLEKIFNAIIGKLDFPKKELRKIDWDSIENSEVEENNKSENFKKTEKLLKKFKTQLYKSDNFKIEKVTAKKILTSIYNNLKEFPFEFSGQTEQVIVGEEIYNNIKLYIPIRNQYIDFIETLMNFNQNEIIISNIIEFFTNLNSLTSRSNVKDYSFVNYEFFLHELFLYTITIALESENYNFTYELLYSPYFFKDTYAINKQHQTFADMDKRQHLQVDKYINKYFIEKRELNKFSPLAEVIKENIHPNYEIDNIVDSDILCCYITNMHTELFNNKDWFPFTYKYKQHPNIELLRRLTSKKHFEKSKILFKAKTVEELQELILITAVNLNKNGYLIHYGHLKSITEYVNIKEIGKY